MNKLFNGRSIGIDLLRSLSMLYIVGFWHMFNYTAAFPGYANLFTNRLTLVILGTFVLISGYLIGQKIIIFNKKSIFTFYTKRLFRIYPLYITAALLFAILKLSNITTLMKSCLMISALIKPSPPTLWFVSMLLLFYTISPLLIYTSRTINANRLITYHIFFTLLLILYSYLTSLLDTRLLMYFPAFAMGVFIANNPYAFKASGLFVTIIIAASIIISFIKTPYTQLNQLANIPMILSCSWQIFKSAKELSISSSRVYQAIILLSYSSYCMYLFHRPIYTILMKFYFPEAHSHQVIYLVLFCLPCIICCSFIIQKTYDLIIASLTLNPVNAK